MKKCVASSAVLWFMSLMGCAIPPDSATVEFGEQRQREWDQLTRMKGQLRWENDRPVRFSYPGDGDVTVRSWRLQGGPGWEYVRARFTYENTTDEAMAWVDVELSVHGSDGENVAASRVRLTHPWGLALAPGTLFSDEIVVPTAGANYSPDGWHWTMVVHGAPEERDDSLPRRIAF